MSTATGKRDLTVDELDQVNGAAMIEFAFGPAKFQFNTNPVDGGYTFWNGRDFVGDQEDDK